MSCCWSITQKPDTCEIRNFLECSFRLRNWFFQPDHKPVIIQFNFDAPESVKLANEQLPRLDTAGELANWLGVTIAELNWLSDLMRYDLKTPEHLKHYHYHLLEKRNGYARIIEQPKNLLKKAQHAIHSGILSSAKIHPAAHGFRVGKNCSSHASVHVGKQYLFTLYIADCFHSIEWRFVKSVFTNLGYSSSVAKYLTAICTHRSRLPSQMIRLLDADQKFKMGQRHLPQGAPSSPALANTVLFRLDNRLAGLAKSLKLDYSRYADDLAFSGNSHRDWQFLEPLIGLICIDEGLSLNVRKSRIKRPHQKQKLVGVVVNEKLNIDRSYYDELKAILTNCVRHGLESQNREQHEHFRAHLLGRIQYVRSLNRNRGGRLQNIYLKIPN